MKIVSFGLSDPGKKREKNEDSFLIDEQLKFYIVADGMGGHLGGDRASQLAVKTCQEVLTAFSQDHEDSPSDELRYAISVASHRIFEEAARSPNLRGMGTTAVALLVREDYGHIVNVGDSRAYLVGRSGIRQMTVDHSLVTEQLQAGFITPTEVKSHKLRNIITRSVGFQDEVETDLISRKLEEGDQFLLCTDGLTNLVSDEEILKQVTRVRPGNPKRGCENLIELANKRGGDDNITVILVSVLKNS